MVERMIRWFVYLLIGALFLDGMIDGCVGMVRKEQAKISAEIEKDRVEETKYIAEMPCREATRMLLKERVDRARWEQDQQVEYFGFKPVQAVP